MLHRLRGGMQRLQKFIGRWWYVPLVAFFAAADAFVVFFPIDALLITRVLSKRERWAWTVFWISLGSAIGAGLLAMLVRQDLISAALLRHVEHSKDWARAVRFVQKYGALGIGFISVGPIPQQPAVVVGAFARVPLSEIFLSVLVGRLLKYGFYGVLSAYFPRILLRFGPIRRAVQDIAGPSSP